MQYSNLLLYGEPGRVEGGSGFYVSVGVELGRYEKTVVNAIDIWKWDLAKGKELGGQHGLVAIRR